MTRRWLAALLSGALAAACATPGPVASPSANREVPLGNPGFEQEPAAGAICPPHWGCSAHNNPRSFLFVVDATSPAAEGKRSLRIERVVDEPWALVTQGLDDPALRGARVRFSIAVRTEGASGNGGGAFMLAQGTAGATIAHQQKLVQQSPGWQRVAVEFVVPQAAQLLEVGAIMEGGGKIWVDDARLERLDAGAKDKNPV